MKHIILTFAFTFNLHLLFAAVPCPWTVEMTRIRPVTFEYYQGETIDFEATLIANGKPFEAPLDYSFFWQTNGMGDAYWEKVVAGSRSRREDVENSTLGLQLPTTTNVLFATWSPEMDAGAKVYKCFIGSPSNNYHTAFQLRLIPSPGATPNALPLPVPVIDFAKVRVLNPPWSGGGGVDTNAVCDIANATIATNDTVKGLASSVSNLQDSKLDAPSASAVTDGNLAVLDKSGNSVTLVDGGVRPADVANSIAYSRATYDYMNGNTNAWFSGTNYVVGAENTNRTHFAFEDGMDLATVPCSMSLWEIRDGKRQCVWDQRDWPTWYWNFKIEQYKTEREERDRELVSRMAGYSPTNWSSHTACGLTNAATDTTWLDTPTVVLSAGYAWQHQLTVDGVGYWGIEGNGCEIGGSGTNSTLRITDWEGNEVFKITKGSARLAYLTGGSGVASGWDGEYMWYDMRTGDSNSAPQPMGEFTIDLREPFYEEGANCPAEVREYEDRGNGVWRCYFRAKPGINANACFARFKVQTGTETTVEYANAPTINGGLIFNGRKIAPVIPANAAVGDVITWKVVQ